MIGESALKRGRRAELAVAVALGLGITGVLVADTSGAAFTAQTANAANTFSSGTVLLSDSGSGTRMFNVSGLNGGQMVERCLNVTYTGSLVADIRLFSAVNNTGGLAPGLTTRIDVGTGASPTSGNSFSCAGFTPDVSGNPLFNNTLNNLASFSSYATGLAGFDGATNPSTKTYRFQVTVSNDNTYQNKSASVDLTWEAAGRNS